MIKAGFICEGGSDFILFQSESFSELLKQLNIVSVNVIDAEGFGNLLPHNIEPYIQSLENKGAEKIVIVTDLDNAECITLTKQRINARPQDYVIIAVKEIESWFIADTTTMRKMLQKQDFNFDFPENELEPFNTINNLLVQYTRRGIGRISRGGKKKLAKRMLDFGFDFRRSSSHPNCPSAKYFIDKLQQIGNSN
jgi:hypothetical protein